MDIFETQSLHATNPEIQDLLGIAALVSDAQGSTLYSHYAGRQTLEPDSPGLSPETVVSLVSAGKFLTHIAALQLVDRGLAILDEPIYGLVPELRTFPIISASTDPAAPAYKLRPETKSITLRHMLTNSSGLGDSNLPLIKEWQKYASGLELPPNTHRIVKNLAFPRLFEPGESWSYGQDVHFLQVVIENASNKKFQDFMRESVFAPLGMDSATYAPSQAPAVRDKMLQLVERQENGGLAPAPEGSVWGIACSIADLQKLFTDLISPKSVLLSEESRELLFQPGLAPSGGALRAFRAEAHEYAVQVGSEKGQVDPPLNYTCAGALLVQGDGLILPAGSLAWDGTPNVAWAVNLEKGIAMVFATQLLPEYEAKVLSLRMEFFRRACSTFM
ncbi:beta-lactamase/transpeptidase-like protein [Lipomyces kononenkoae]|uniref:Beta-lactamase/transpeptidase-like protein n=1 Tax=Lipomyces kononenkoae TaxID=34357 RepID=A0ACC3SSN8_LIPKO